MNTYKILIIIAFIASLTSLGIQFKGETLGNIFSEPNAYSSAVTYTSSTLTNSVATSLVPRAANSRTYATVCVRHDSANIPIFLFKQATSTGVAVDIGFPIYTTSTTSGGNCMTVNANDPYTGQIWGISSATTTVTIEYHQN